MLRTSWLTMTATSDGHVNGSGLSKRKASLFTVLNLATLGLILAWLAFDWYAIAYLTSH